MNELALFAGAGGGILGGKLLGWNTVCAVERDLYAASVLVQRQNDGILPPFPIWSDVSSFDGRPWRGIVDVVSGGFPCQDISAAGKGAGISGERSGLWAEMVRIIDEVRPQYAFVENSPMLVGRGLTRVLSDLASIGYDAKWCVLGAHHVGAPHKRDRIWILATDTGFEWAQRREQQPQGGERARHVSHALRTERESGARRRRIRQGDTELANANELYDDAGRYGASEVFRHRQEKTHIPAGEREICDAQSKGLEGFGVDSGKPEEPESGNSSWWATEPELGRVAHGLAHRVDRLRAIGNGQVPEVAATAWRVLV